MHIESGECGFRELIRLSNFIKWMIDNHPEDAICANFTYDMHYDEPCYYFYPEYEMFYSRDYNLGFDLSGNAVELD